jgi:hypothetical protein
MKNLLLLLLLANILYFLWGRFVQEEPETGIAVVDETTLGPPLTISRPSTADTPASIGAMLGSGKSTDLAAVVGRSCITVGPFKTNEEAEVARSDFEGQGMRVAVRGTQGQIFVGHWVQIRNIPDRATGNEMLATLRAGGLADAYLVPTEDEGLKISLGLFGEIDRAERVELQAKSMDLPADITPRMREAAIFFVDIALPPGKGAGAIIEQYGEDKVHLREAATCPRRT